MADTKVPAPRRPERPNTVAGLLAKRAELDRYRVELEAELRRVACDLTHIEAAIRLFDPASAPAAIRRYAARNRAGKGQVARFVLGALRDAGGPMTSREVTLAWAESQGLRTDHDAVCVLRKRIAACLMRMRARGLVRNGEGREGHVGYELAGD